MHHRSAVIVAVLVFSLLSIQGKEIIYKDSAIELPPNVENALSILDDGGLIQIAEAAVSSLDVFNGVVDYLTQSYLSTRCQWLDDDLPGSISNGWQYDSSDRVVSGPHTIYCNLEETFDPFCADCLDSSELPEDLYHEIEYYASNGLSCLARIKWTAWTQYGLVWDEELFDLIGVVSDHELWSGIGYAIYTLDPSGSYTASFAKEGVDRKNDMKVSLSKHIPELSILSIERQATPDRLNRTRRTRRAPCSVPDPVTLVTPNVHAVFEVLGNIFADIIGTTTAVSATMGVRACSGYRFRICVEETLGFTADAQLNAFIAEQTSFDFAESSNWETPHVDAKFVIEFSVYENIEVVHGTQLSRETTDQLGDWITAPSIIFNNTGSAVGVAFAAEVYINVTEDGEVHIEVDQGVPLGTISVNPIATLVSDDVIVFGEQKQFYDDNVGHSDSSTASTAGTHFFSYIVVIGVLICICIIAAKLYSKNILNMKASEAEFQPLLENEC